MRLVLRLVLNWWKVCRLLGARQLSRQRGVIQSTDRNLVGRGGKTESILYNFEHML
jgi:hypothetical protein